MPDADAFVVGSDLGLFRNASQNLKETYLP